MFKVLASTMLVANMASAAETVLYTGEYTAVPRATADTGDLKLGYGMKGSYKLIDSGNSDGKKTFEFTTAIEAQQIKNLQYF